MNLLNAWLQILRDWSPAFAQSRTAQRAVDHALGSVLALGRRTLSRSLWALQRHQQDWSADYKLHSRAAWNTQDLFQPVLQQAAPFCDDSLLVVAMDDTRIRKTGRKILTAFYQRDPLSPKFRFNLMWGLRFLHFSLLLPLYRSHAEVPPRSLPVRFLEVPAIKKPGKKATPARVKRNFETRRSMMFSDYLPFVFGSAGSGLLIQTSEGKGSGLGGCRNEWRSGWRFVGTAASSTACRWAKTVGASPK